MNDIPEKIRLTQFAHGAGCGCKIAPSVLEEILKDSKTDSPFPRLLVGNESGDDAAVYELDGDSCLISTTDFFMPIVDDPFTFGRIAACNALSDVYAMGGTPILALAVLGFPVEKIAVDVAQQILKGGTSVCREAGIPLAGGHSIDSPEPIFGLAVNGLVSKKNLRRNNTARNGDLIFLTKPLGTGILTTAFKRKLISEDELQPAVDVMCSLNTAGEPLARHDYVHAMTDVTGFGLLGHLIELCEGSGLGAEINYSSIPLIAGAAALSAKFVAPDNTFRNWKSFEPKVSGIAGESLITLCDPQTNGGLLIAVDPTHADDFINVMSDLSGGPSIQPIGRINAAVPGQKIIRVIN
jgi:selenide,water dikinase